MSMFLSFILSAFVKCVFESLRNASGLFKVQIISLVSGVA